MKKEVISSPIRWAGSKKKVLNEMLEYFDNSKSIYIEPFLGSAIVLINVLNNSNELQYKEFYVNDINPNIISFFKNLKSHSKRLIQELNYLSMMYNNLDECGQEEYYYHIRSEFNCMENNDFNKCVYFYFLMKVGFNGVYRENKNGNFNVPFGRKSSFIVQEYELKNISTMLRKYKVHFYNLDYNKFLQTLKKKDKLKDSFLYCDPPYVPEDLSVSRKQELYTNTDFDHYLLVKSLKSIDTSVMISMSYSELADKIYGSVFNKKTIRELFRTINPKRLLCSKEIIFYNYFMNEKADSIESEI